MQGSVTQVLTNAEDAFQAFVTLVKMNPEIREFLTLKASYKPHPGVFLVKPHDLLFPDQCPEKLIWFTRRELVDKIGYRRFRDDGIEDCFDSFSTVPNTFSVLCLTPVPMWKSKRKKKLKQNAVQCYMGTGAFFANYHDGDMAIMHIDYDENKNAKIGRNPTVSNEALNYNGGMIGRKFSQPMDAKDCIAKCANPGCDATELKKSYRKETLKKMKSVFPKSAKCWKVPHQLQLCGRCRNVLYCSRECQKRHWKQHKSSCGVAV